MNNQSNKYVINIEEISRLLLSDPKKKKIVQVTLNIDKTAFSKILNNKRRIEGGELLTIAQILEVDPYSLALHQ